MRRIALDHRQNPVVKYKEIHAALSRSPNLRDVRRVGDHEVYVGPTGSVPVPHDHGGDCPKWTWKSIVRMAVAAGLAVLTLVIVLAL